MNLNDLRSLRVPLILLAVTLALGFGLPYYSNIKLEEAKREYAHQQSQLREARTRLHKAGEEREIIVHYLSAYQYLQRLGLIGDEQRINWLDGLRLTNQSAKLFGVDYQISAQQPYPYASELNPGQLALYQSVMKIRFSLLHEEDLLRFLGTLAGQNAGVFSVNQCVMDRVTDVENTGFQPNLRADCELAWITMRPIDPAENKKS